MKQVLSFLILVLLVCCKEGTETKKIQSTAIKPECEEPKFRFENKSFDFGNVVMGEKVSISFKYWNVGAKALKIQSAKGSCGCTSINFEKGATASGDSGFVEVVFDSDGFHGPQFKTVTILANTKPEESKLEFSAVVIQK